MRRLCVVCKCEERSQEEDESTVKVKVEPNFDNPVNSYGCFDEIPRLETLPIETNDSNNLLPIFIKYFSPFSNYAYNYDNESDRVSSFRFCDKCMTFLDKLTQLDGQLELIKSEITHVIAQVSFIIIQTEQKIKAKTKKKSLIVNDFVNEDVEIFHKDVCSHFSPRIILADCYPNKRAKRRKKTNQKKRNKKSIIINDNILNESPTVENRNNNTIFKNDDEILGQSQLILNQEDKDNVFDRDVEMNDYFNETEEEEVDEDADDNWYSDHSSVNNQSHNNKKERKSSGTIFGKRKRKRKKIGANESEPKKEKKIERPVKISDNVFCLSGQYKYEKNEKGYQCLTCGSQMIDAAQILRHINIKHNSNWIPCSACGRAWRDQKKFDQHNCKPKALKRITCKKVGIGKYLYNGTLPFEKLSDAEKAENGGYDYKCGTCNAITKGRGLMNAHLRRCHTDLQNYCCDTCGKCFTNARSFEHHKTIHDPVPRKDYLCTQCGKTFRTPHLLNNHKQFHEDPSVRHPCELCGQTFRFKNGLRRHRVNTGHWTEEQIQNRLKRQQLLALRTQPSQPELEIATQQLEQQQIQQEPTTQCNEESELIIASLSASSDPSGFHQEPELNSNSTTIPIPNSSNNLDSFSQQVTTNFSIPSFPFPGFPGFRFAVHKN